MSTTPKPRRIEWTGPESWTVWTDEDGTHLRTPQGTCLEMPDVERLFTLWSRVREMSESGVIPAPKPPSRDEVRAQSSLSREEWIKRRALTAIKREFDDSDIAPF
jgi:hypothetical protein